MSRQDVEDGKKHVEALAASSGSTSRLDLLKDDENPDEGGWVVFSRGGDPAEVIEIADCNPTGVSI